jgi:hypothetical protein
MNVKLDRQETDFEGFPHSRKKEGRFANRPSSANKEIEGFEGS